MTTPGRVVLVTGATGFLGSAVVELLASARFQIRATGRRVRPRHLSGADYRLIDLTRPDAGVSLVAGVDTVVHCAGLAHRFEAGSSLEFQKTNVEATAHLVEAAVRAGVRHFVYVSSVSVYGPGSGERDESTPCRPMGAYAESKREAEKAAVHAAQGSAVRLTILRMPTLYGTGDPGNMARLIRALAGGRFVWIGTGANRKSLLHRKDAARACLAVVKRNERMSGIPDPETFNVPSDVRTMREIVDEVVRALGRRPPRLRVPAGSVSLASWIARRVPHLAPLALSLEKWLQDDCYDGRKFRDRSGFIPSVSIQEGIAEEVAWIRGAVEEQ